MAARNKPLAWKAHLENYAELYERARNTPTPTKITMGGKQKKKAKVIIEQMRAQRGSQ